MTGLGQAIRAHREMKGRRNWSESLIIIHMCSNVYEDNDCMYAYHSVRVDDGGNLHVLVCVG